MKGCVLLGIDRPTQNPNFQMACSQGSWHPGPELRGAPQVLLGGLVHLPHLQQQPPSADRLSFQALATGSES